MKADPLPDPHEFDQARLASGDSQLIGDDLKAHHCRWPVGAPDLVNWRLCCLPREPGLPYCEHHLQRASAALKPVKAIRNIQHVETGHLTVAANVAEFLEPA
jgi:hypothetical protein